ncbi:MAG: MurT ligase domain-containing protein [Bacillota bacterium]|nr:MurT ligase domain-containing protein [Bacillota bacterium]
MPGKAALKICPGLLEYLARDVKVIAVTGTNGKTTSVRMVEAALKNAELPVFSNKSGANLIEGITAEFVMNSDLLGRPKCDWAVIECDEAAAQRVFDEIKPVAVLLTNLFKDQSDRYGDVKKPMEMIAAGLKKSPETVLAVNADCHLTSAIAEKLDNKALYFALEGNKGRKPDASEENRCVFCGGKILFRTVTYSNLGSWYCPACGRKRKRPQVFVRDVAEDRMLVDMGGEQRICGLALPAVYNVYNAAGMLAAVTAAGIDAKYALAAAENFQGGFGRMEEFPLGESGAEMILVKNTAAVNQTLDYIKTLEGEKTVVFIQNANAGDGRDLSWIYDADFEKLRRMRGLRRIIVAGDCKSEMQARLKRAGVEAELSPDYESLISGLSREINRIFLLPSYTAMLELRQRLVRKLGGKNFWE